MGQGWVREGGRYCKAQGTGRYKVVKVGRGSQASSRG